MSKHFAGVEAILKHKFNAFYCRGREEEIGSTGSFDAVLFQKKKLRMRKPYWIL